MYSPYIVKNLYTSVINSIDQTKGYAFDIGTHSVSLVRYNRRSTIATAVLPFGFMTCAKKENGDYAGSRWKASEHSAKLLCGLLYCGACGGKMVGAYNMKKTPNGVVYYPVYRCYRGSIKARRTENEQYSYTASRIEETVLTLVKAYFASFTATADAVWKEQVRRQLKNQHDQRIRELLAKVEKLQNQQSHLRQEVIASVTGDSTFDTELLKSLLQENSNALLEAEARLSESRQEKEVEQSKLQSMYAQFSNIAAWAEEFDQVDIERKKMILAKIIRRITVEKDYKIHIQFFFTQERMMEAYKAANIKISEAKTWYIAGA